MKIESPERFAQVRAQYQDEQVATLYDARRFESFMGRRRNRYVLQAVERALDRARELGPEVRLGLDVPCGTGRLFPVLLARRMQFIGVDISMEMMATARAKLTEEQRASCALMRCDAEKMPFPDDTFDSIFSFRFMHLLPREHRILSLREMERVSARWVIVEFRHQYCFEYYWRQWRRKLGLRTRDVLYFSHERLVEELTEAGLELVEIFPAHRLLSNKWIVLARPAS
jgi:ubiquinone/menaquinone biosynthesis C-methylase UbiE